MNKLSTVRTENDGPFRAGRCDDNGFQQVILVDSSGVPGTGSAVAIDQTTPGTTNGVVVNAGANLIGKVGIDQTTPGTTDSVSVKPSASVVKVATTRPNDTAPYLANDILGTATGATAALTFANAGVTGKVVRVTGAKLEIDVAVIPSGMTSFRLHVYSATPPSALGDNAPWDLPAGDRPSYLGYVDLGNIVDVGSTLYVQSTGLDYDFQLVSTSLFGYLVTNGAFTPTALTVKSVTLVFFPL